MSDKIDFTGRIALITGASQGIGAAVAKAYAVAGAHVILLARSQKKLEQIDDEIREAGGQATLMPFDLMNLEELEKLGPTIYERFGKLDILVANAGLLGTLGPLAQISVREFKHVMDTNLSANFHLIRTLDPLLRASDAGRAIFVTTSPGVTSGRAYWGTYAVSKAALDTMVKVYAAETAQTNLRVNLLNPGAVRTDMRASAVPGEDPMSLPAPEDIVEVFLELAGESCTHHGQVLSA
ncbi:MAG: SDR family NAD(P)-dependent oxidoreductase [Alphaproteobacteria bacterium]|nr:SDR family NAD(P)-dependent oxidoreductase [Alphaproteobacteria bacterium]